MPLAEEDDAQFLGRKMRMRQSMCKCLDCETAAEHGRATPYLFPRAQRGNRCPFCGGNKVMKISISAVMEHRWEINVRNTLEQLRGKVTSIPKLQV